jgi:DNA-binding LytR/AlgR family response regulator
MIRCLLVDDEPLALKVLSDYVCKVEGFELVDAATDVYKALEMVQNNLVDLVFLDIQMPELTGIQFMKIIQGKCPVILTTAYPDYALQGFDFNVLDYLLKPISMERFLVAANKARERLITKQGKTVPATSIDYFFVKSEYKIVKINYADVLFCEGMRDYTAIHTRTGKILTLQSMQSLEQSLPASVFLRVNKSFIIAINKIDFIEKNRVVIGDTYIPVGESYKEQFNRLLKNDH